MSSFLVSSNSKRSSSRNSDPYEQSSAVYKCTHRKYKRQQNACYFNILVRLVIITLLKFLNLNNGFFFLLGRGKNFFKIKKKKKKKNLKKKKKKKNIYIYKPTCPFTAHPQR